jgi:hypothetical protein
VLGVDHEARAGGVGGGPAEPAPHLGRAEDRAVVVDRHEGMRRRAAQPVGPRLLLGDVAIPGEGLAGRGDRAHEAPDRGPVGGGRVADQHADRMVAGYGFSVKLSGPVTVTKQ